MCVSGLPPRGIMAVDLSELLWPRFPEPFSGEPHCTVCGLLHVWLCTHTHTRTHGTNTQAHTHTQKYAYSRACVCTCTHTHVCPCTHTTTLIHTHARTDAATCFSRVILRVCGHALCQPLMHISGAPVSQTRPMHI